jgi:phosphonate transport system permease protein
MRPSRRSLGERRSLRSCYVLCYRTIRHRSCADPLFLAKLFSEAVEAIDPRPVEAIRTTGASRVQQVIYGVIPQVLPLWISYSLYRLESNVRSATVLGIIGAGGIGQVLFESIRAFYYPEASAILIIVVITVTMMDLISQLLRRLVI